MSSIASIGGAAQGISSLQSASTSGTSSKALSDVSKSFASVLDQVNQQQAAASQAVSAIASGKEVNLSGVVSSLIKAELSMKMLLEVRNKVVEAHQDLMRMQV